MMALSLGTSGLDDGGPHHDGAAATAPCRHSRWRRRTLRASGPAPRRRRATGRPSRAAAPSRWSGCSPAMPNLRVIMAASRVPMARCVFRTLYGSCIFSPSSKSGCGVARSSARPACRAPRCGPRPCSSTALAPASACASSGLRSRSSRCARAAAHLLQQVGAADHLVQRAKAELGQDLAHLLGDEAEQVDHLLRRARRTWRAASGPACRRRPGRCWNGTAAP